MKKIFLLSMLVMFILSSACFAADRYRWISSIDTFGYFFDTQTIKHIPKEGDQESFMRNPDKILTDDGYIEVWIKYVYNEQGIQNTMSFREKNGFPNDGFENLSYSLELYQIKTNKQEMALLENIYYNSDNIVLASYHTYPYMLTWEKAVPSSVGEDIYKSILNHELQQYRTLKKILNYK